MISFHRVFKNFISIFSAHIFSRLIGIGTAIILARYLGPEDYGKYSLVISVAFIFGVISDFGLNELIIKDIAADYSIAPKYLGSSLIIKPIFSFLSILILVLSIYLLGYSEEIILCTIVFSLHLIFITTTNTMLSIFKAFEKMEYVSLIMILNGLTGLVFIAIVVYYNGSLLNIIGSRVLSYFLAFMVALLIVIRQFVKPDFSSSMSFLKTYLLSGLPFLFITIAETLYYKVDIIMLSKMKGELYVGWYVPVSNDLFFGLWAIASAISTVVYPIFSRQYNESIDQFRSSCDLTIKISTTLGVAIGAGSFMLASEIIHLIFGPQYESAAVVLRIFSLGIVFLFIREPIGFGLVAAGKVRIVVWVYLTILGINILLNWILIRLYAHVGAAITQVVCIILSSLLIFYLLNKTVTHLKMWKNFIKPIIAAFVMCLSIYVLRGFNLISVIMVGGVVYFCVIFALKTFDSKEIAVFRGLLTRRSVQFQETPKRSVRSRSN
ncbi:MAG: flippase [Deltaproteobacteria bacterium]